MARSLPLAVTLVGPLDALRRAVLHPFAPWLGRWLRDRALRVSLAGTLSVCVSLSLTAWWPLWLMALGPLVLGAAHLAADARYLVVRQALHRRAAVMASVIAPALVASWRPSLVWVLAPALGAALVARGDVALRALVAALAAMAYVVARSHEGLAWVVIAHAHHVVALVAWWWWCRAPRGPRVAVVAAVAAGFALIFSGALDSIALRAAALRAPGHGIDFETLTATLSPVDPWREPLVAARWVLAFAFGQSVHYGLWLRLIPEEDREREAPRTFAGSALAATRDLGSAALNVTLIATIALLAWATRDVSVARGAYLRIAAGHGGLELGALALLACEGRLRREGRDR